MGKNKLANKLLARSIRMMREVISLADEAVESVNEDGLAAMDPEVQETVANIRKAREEVSGYLAEAEALMTE